VISDLLRMIPDSRNEDFLFNNRDNKGKIVQLGILRLLNNDLFYSEMRTNGSFNDFCSWATVPATRTNFLKKKYEWSDAQIIALWTLLGSADVFSETIPDPDKSDGSHITVDQLNRRSMGILQIKKGTRALGLSRLKRAGLKRKINLLGGEAEDTLKKCKDKLLFRSDSLVNFLVAHPGSQKIDYNKIWSLPFALQPENAYVSIKSVETIPQAQEMLEDALYPVANIADFPGINSSGSVQELLQDLKDRVQEAEKLKAALRYATPGVNTSMQGRLVRVLDEMDDVIKILKNIV